MRGVTEGAARDLGVGTTRGAALEREERVSIEEDDFARGVVGGSGMPIRRAALFVIRG